MQDFFHRRPTTSIDHGLFSPSRLCAPPTLTRLPPRESPAYPVSLCALLDQGPSCPLQRAQIVSTTDTIVGTTLFTGSTTPFFSGTLSSHSSGPLD